MHIKKMLSYKFMRMGKKSNVSFTIRGKKQLKTVNELIQMLNLEDKARKGSVIMFK